MAFQSLPRAVAKGNEDARKGRITPAAVCAQIRLLFRRDQMIYSIHRISNDSHFEGGSDGHGGFEVVLKFPTGPPPRNGCALLSCWNVS
jgi:hypothetical protein